MKKGHQHLMTQIITEIDQIFGDLGFLFVEGPEVETSCYNFDRLNIPANHPARDMHDTFWLHEADVSEPSVLRTHTSPVQARYMEKHSPPIRIIAPGKVFRNEATDATHEAQFFQLEGLYVDNGVNMSHLKGTLEYFFTRFFGGEVATRFRPSYFPFVEPGVEVDMKIKMNQNKKEEDTWLEVMGAGMVHPNVLRESGVDPEIYSGFAFGVGVDRLAVIRHGVSDIRQMYTGDLRFVNQF